MKKIILLTLISALLFAGCAKGEVITSTAPPETTTAPPTHNFEYVTFDAKVMKKDGTNLLLGDLGDTVGSIFYLTTDDDTIKAGDIVEVTFNGMIMESYPPQLGDPSLKLKEKGTSALPMLEEIFHELWERDEGLNNNLDLIAVDLDKINVISDIEKEAFIKILDNYMYTKYDISVIASNYEKLKSENMLAPYSDIKDSYHFENGLIFSFDTQEDTSIPVTSFTLTVSKWRSPLGAYGFTINSKLKNDEWTYKIENEFIS